MDGIPYGAVDGRQHPLGPKCLKCSVLKEKSPNLSWTELVQTCDNNDSFREQQSAAEKERDGNPAPFTQSSMELGEGGLCLHEVWSKVNVEERGSRQVGCCPILIDLDRKDTPTTLRVLPNEIRNISSKASWANPFSHRVAMFFVPILCSASTAPLKLKTNK